MRTNGTIKVAEGTSVLNLTLPSGTTFPPLENNAEVFILTTTKPGYERGLYAYDATVGKWRLKADMDTVLLLLAAHTDDVDLHVSAWPQVKNNIASDETLVVKPGYQVLVTDTLIVDGVLDIHGEVIIA